jgi:hypothetical protein
VKDDMARVLGQVLDQEREMARQFCGSCSLQQPSLAGRISAETLPVDPRLDYTQAQELINQIQPKHLVVTKPHARFLKSWWLQQTSSGTVAYTPHVHPFTHGDLITLKLPATFVAGFADANVFHLLGAGAGVGEGSNYVKEESESKASAVTAAYVRLLLSRRDNKYLVRDLNASVISAETDTRKSITQKRPREMKRSSEDEEERSANASTFEGPSVNRTDLLFGSNNARTLAHLLVQRLISKGFTDACVVGDGRVSESYEFNVYIWYNVNVVAPHRDSREVVQCKSCVQAWSYTHRNRQ